MANRGRVSAAEREAPNPVGGSVAVLAQRPDPPAWLGDEEAAEWVAIVNRLAADWFPRETHFLLEQYCCHIVEARRLAFLLEDLNTFDETVQAYELDGSEMYDDAGDPIVLRAAYPVDKRNKILMMREREVRSAQSLARSMRLTQQTTYDKSKRKPGKHRTR